MVEYLTSEVLAGEDARTTLFLLRTSVLDRMCGVIAHRGPDESGVHLEGPVGLGIRRLRVIDLATGRQPIANEDGTVTIVFTDIESSTQQAEAFGDERWFKVLTTHNRVVRDRLAEYAGVEVKSQGDGFMLTFASARRALECMITVQRDMTALRAQRPEPAVRIRVGAHTGEAIVGDDGDLFGLHVNIAARIAGQARGDEILVSSLVREIVATRGDLRFGEPRRTALKGLAGTFVLHAVLWADAPAG